MRDGEDRDRGLPGVGRTGAGGGPGPGAALPDADGYDVEIVDYH